MEGLDLQIEKMKHDTGLSYIDTVIEFTKDTGLDFEDIVKELHVSIIDKIKQEFVILHMVDGREDKKKDRWKSKKHETGLEDFF